MNTIRTLAMQWFNELDTYNKSELSHKYYKETISYNFTSLTGREIENIFYNEVILKWWFNLDNVHQFCLIQDYPHHNTDEIYLKEHSKEESKKYTKIDWDNGLVALKWESDKADKIWKLIGTPKNKTCNYKYLIAPDWCEKVCNVTNNTSLPIVTIDEIFEQPLLVNKDVEVDEEKDDSELWYEIYSLHPITWETPAVKQVIQYIQQHYTLIKKQ